MVAVPTAFSDFQLMITCNDQLVTTSQCKARHPITFAGSEPEPSDYSTDDDENGYDVETEAEFEDWEEEEAAEADKYMSNNRQEDEETQSANEISLRESTLKALRAKALEVMKIDRRLRSSGYNS